MVQNRLLGVATISTECYVETTPEPSINQLQPYQLVLDPIINRMFAHSPNKLTMPNTCPHLAIDVYGEAKTYYEQKKYEKAFPLFEQAAEQGHVGAQFYLARMYSNGESIEQDEEQSVFWLRKAAEQGHVDAQHNLGWIHFLRASVVEENGNDNQAMLFWFRKAAEQGHVDAQNLLGYLYTKEFCGIPRDNKQAVFWYRKAAEQGHVDSQFNLAKMYMDGLSIESRSLYVYGIPQDFDQAAFWLRKAAEQGHAEAQSNLGFLYRYGKGVAKSFSQAENWYEKAAKQGNADAVVQLSKRRQWWLGNLLLNGHGLLPKS